MKRACPKNSDRLDENAEQRNNVKDKNNKEKTYMAVERNINQSSSPWFLDSGASEYCTGVRRVFETFMVVKPFAVSVSDNYDVMVTGVGNVYAGAQDSLGSRPKGLLNR